MPKSARFPSVLPERLEELARHLTEINEAGGERANEFAITTLVHFFVSLGFKNEMLLRLCDQQKEVEALKESLRKADQEKDPLKGTLIAVSGILAALEPLGLARSRRLEGLERGLLDVAQGHPPPHWLETDINHRPPYTLRERKIKVCASALMQLYMDANGNKAGPAAEEVAKVLARSDYKLKKSGKATKADAVKKRVDNWRKKVMNSTNVWESDLYQRLTRPTSIDRLMGRTEAVERLLEKAIAEAN